MMARSLKSADQGGVPDFEDYMIQSKGWRFGGQTDFICIQAFWIPR